LHCIYLVAGVRLFKKMRYDFHTKKFADKDVDANKLAIAGSDGDITWSELEKLVETISSQFKQLNIPKGHPVIIYGHKEYLFPAAMLACIHSSIPYVPIDKMYPIERINKIISVTESQVLINCSDEKNDFHLPIHISKKLEVTRHAAADFSDKIYGTATDPLQYIIFTSGSTGEPKGVQITKDASVAFTDWLINDYGYTANDIFINQAPFSFDLSLYDLMSTYAVGGSIVLNTAEVAKDQLLFLKRIALYQCTTWISTPSFVFTFLRNPDFCPEKLPHLKTFLFIGEEFPNRTAAALKKIFPQARLLNAYGPTEATVATTLIEITEDIIKNEPSLPIGYPMPGSELYIENPDEQTGEGELIIAGTHVSIGYFKNETLNEKKYFVHNGKRAFRTGDVAYFKGDVLFFIGRNDDQVKMHGFRIELNEINNVISEIPEIADAVTIPLKRNNEVKKIVSFITLKKTIEKDSIKQLVLKHTTNKLPYYMIPGDVAIVNELPYNTNHKIDKKQLIENYILQQTS